MDHSEVKHLPKVDHTPAELDGASRLLLRAADVIESKGWIQGHCELDGGYCVQGAIKIAHHGYANGPLEGPSETAYERFREAIGQRSVISWNDAKGRTKDEVVAKLRSAAFGG